MISVFVDLGQGVGVILGGNVLESEDKIGCNVDFGGEFCWELQGKNIRIRFFRDLNIVIRSADWFVYVWFTNIRVAIGLTNIFSNTISVSEAFNTSSIPSRAKR